MSDKRASFQTWALLAAGGLMAAFFGLCSAAATAWLLPSIVTQARDHQVSLIFLVPSLVIGGLGMLAGGALFHRARRGRAAPDRIDLVASGLTAAVAGLYALAFALLTLASVSMTVDQLNSPYGTNPAATTLAVSGLLVFALLASACAWLAWRAVERFKAAR